jgi:hypothetical protein
MDELIGRLNAQNAALGAMLRALNFAENFQADIREVVLTGPSPSWIELSDLANDWNEGGPAPTARIEPGGHVFLRGKIDSGTIPAVALTLPLGYRPAVVGRFAVESNSAAGTVEIATNGQLTVLSGSNTRVSLDGISFYAAATAAHPTPLTWPQTAPQLQLSPEMTRVVGIWPIAFRPLDSTPELAMGMPNIEWEQVPPRAVKLRTVWGLQPGRRYSLQLLLIGG